MKKQTALTVIPSTPCAPDNSHECNNSQTFDFLDHDSSALYVKNEETGLWEVRNPSGSTGYNYLYRDDYIAGDG